MHKKIDEDPNRPLLKKSKTISRHHSSLPSTTTSTAAAGCTTTTTSTGGAKDLSFDRDYVYPSFLGPYAARNRVNVRTKSTPLTSTSDVDSSRRSSGGVKTKLKANRDLNSLLAAQVSAASLTASAQSSLSSNSAPKASSFRKFTSFHLMKLICLVSVSYAIYLRVEVTKLEETNSNILRTCVCRYASGNDALEVMKLENASLFSYVIDADKRQVALCTVIFTLVTPFFLYRYLDYLPRVKHLSIRSRNNKEEVPLKKRIAYVVDVCFSVYPYAKLLALLYATLFLIAFGGLALYAVSDGTFAEALWRSWTFVADSGNHADTVGTGPRIVSVSISSGGMLIFAMMLGLVSDAISEKVDSLRKGKSEVIESNHILILGWSDKLGSLLKQLAIANKSIGGGVVVVLAERDKEEMELDIAKLEFDFMGTSVICRSGSPLILADLKKVSVSKARAIIVLASDENADQIWEDILGFENAEFYIKRWPQLDGLSFGDVLISFPDAVPCGVKVSADDGKIIINPDDSYILREGDEVLVIAEDDDTYSPGSLPEVHRGLVPRIRDPPKYPERILFCGWRRDIDDMIMVLEALLAPGSELWMFNEVPEKDREQKLTDGGLDITGLQNITLIHREGNAVIRRHLENLPLEKFDSVSSSAKNVNPCPLFFLAPDESVEDSVVHSDSRSLATLLLIRDIQVTAHSKRLPYYKDTKSIPLRHSGFSQSSWIRDMQQASYKSIVISEILDSRTRNLVSVSRISDYVLSNELVSMALAMVAEDKQINRVLEELFAEEGNEMCIKPAEFYLYDQEELCFYDIVIRGRQRREIVIGYRLATAERAVINPERKSEPRKWSLDDIFVVISISE
ncbi:hypothetical protein Leryth_007314 [Lithospermum erythrorhizon]|nr:hypothetical protein Leryth_007314 [Lithospermum erythrorhizon]